MTGTAGFLAGWRAWRAAQAAQLVPGVPGTAQPLGTPPNPKKTANVPGVPIVSGKTEDGVTQAADDAVAIRAAGYARFQAEAAAAIAAPDPDLAADRAVMALHYAAPTAPHLYQPGDPDPLRDGLLLGWRNHRPATP